MSAIKRDWDILSDDERRHIINEIISFFETERGERIGVVAAGQILDFFLRISGPLVYNRALDDAKSALEKGLNSSLLDVEVMLRKSVK